MADNTFAQALNDQISSEFAAHQAYLSAAIYYEDLTMPQMASFFYRQALEERNHAMMIVKYLLDTEAEGTVPGVRARESGLCDVVLLRRPDEAADGAFPRPPGARGAKPRDDDRQVPP